MNIFILDIDPGLAAQFHADKHVVKMILESAQLLSTAHYALDGVVRDYKPTHINHPCSIWTRQTTSNYTWLYSLFKELSAEYTRRYGKEHKSWATLKDVLRVAPRSILRDTMTPFALAMPDKYKSGNPVTSYRNYYKGEKQNMLTYKTTTPYWL